MTALNGLMLTYPVHQAAVLFCKATIVPVGGDQLPHIEQTRAIARRFNRRYAAEHPVFPEPEAMLSDAPTLLGIDGRKMSKSRNNAIALAPSTDETARLLGRAKTDSDPNITHDPENRPEVANLVLLTPLCEELDPRELAEQIGSHGAAELKHRATEAVNERLRPIRDRRAELMRDRGRLRTILRDGSARARSIAEETLGQVTAAMYTNY
jgi:tryptophanyl-tRNA synthetase